MRDIVHWTGGVAKRSFSMFAGFFDGFNRDTQIAQVVHRIEHAEHVDAVIGRLLHKSACYIIRVMPVTQ